VINKPVDYSIIGLAALALVLLSPEILAAKKQRPGDVEQGDAWKTAPYDFEFDNHMDTHVQLKLDVEGGEPVELWGSMYIIFTDDQGVSLGIDPVSDLPIARHPRGTNDDHDETCGTSVNIVCEVGWYVDAVPGAFKFLYHSGVNGNDHGMWMVNRAEEYPSGGAPVPGMVIPQPFIPSHAHWISLGSDDPRAGSVSAACDKNNAGQLEDEDPTAVNQVCQGWFMELKAVKAFAFEHGGKVIPIYPGEDLRSHLNIVTNYNQTPVEDITATRSSSGH
jgi:hypothetical protein